MQCQHCSGAMKRRGMLLICSQCDEAVVTEAYREPAYREPTAYEPAYEPPPDEPTRPARTGLKRVFVGLAAAGAFAISYTIDLPEDFLAGVPAQASNSDDDYRFETVSFSYGVLAPEEGDAAGTLVSSLGRSSPPQAAPPERPSALTPAFSSADPAPVREPAIARKPELVARSAPDAGVGALVETAMVADRAATPRSVSTPEPETDPRAWPATRFVCRLDCSSAIDPSLSFPLEQTYERPFPELAATLELMVAGEMLGTCMSLDGQADLESGLRCDPRS